MPLQLNRQFSPAQLQLPAISVLATVTATNMTQSSSTKIENGRLWGAAGQAWAEIQEPLCKPVYLAAFDKLQLGPNSQYLDAGCGSGVAAQLAHERGANITGVDAAPNLLAIATQRVPAAQFHHADLERLPLADNRFDCITGFNSFQYAGDPTQALREAKRVANKEALVVIATWGEPQGMEAAQLVAALKPLLPPAPPNKPGPFALSAPAALQQLANNAELEPLEVFDVDSPWFYPNIETAITGLCSSGVAIKAIEHSGREAVEQANINALSPFQQIDGSYHIGATFRCLLARA